MLYRRGLTPGSRGGTRSTEGCHGLYRVLVLSVAGFVTLPFSCQSVAVYTSSVQVRGISGQIVYIIGAVYSSCFASSRAVSRGETVRLIFAPAMPPSRKTMSWSARVREA